MFRIIKYKNKWSIAVDFPYIKFPKLKIPKFSLPKIDFAKIFLIPVVGVFGAMTKSAAVISFALVIVAFFGVSAFAVYKVFDIPGIYSSFDKSAEIKIKIGKQIVAEIKTGSKNQTYDIKPIPKKEVVQGYKGKYFSIQLLDPENQIPIYFKSGSYSLNEMESKFLLSINDFHKKILNKVSVLKARVFIQGMADSLDKNFSSPFFPFDCNSDTVSPFKYHPMVYKGNNIFSESLEIYSIKSEVGNKDLPFLRARFLQCKLQSLYQETPIEIVQGGIDPEIQEASRKGSFILYIPEDGV